MVPGAAALQPDRGRLHRACTGRCSTALKAQGRNVYYFGYDWRKDLNVSDPLLDQKINAVLAATGKDKVILVGHSMGGMLARHYILKYGAGKVDQIITFGTPYLGSVNPAKYLEMGDNMGMVKDIAGPCTSSSIPTSSRRWP